MVSTAGVITIILTLFDLILLLLYVLGFAIFGRYITPVIMFIILMYIILSIKINKEWERAVILRLGKYKMLKTAGLFVIIPFIERAIKVDLRTQVMDVKPQEIMSKDSVPVEVDAVVYYKVKEPTKAILNVEDFEDASVKLAQTTLRDLVGKSTLDDLLQRKEKIGEKVQKILDIGTNPWGINVEMVEIRDVILPEMLKRAMAKEAEATREKLARVIKSSAEKDAAKNFSEAAKLMAKTPGALELRQLQTWTEIGAEQNSLMIVIPSKFAAKPEFVTGLAALGQEELKKIKKKDQLK